MQFISKQRVVRLKTTHVCLSTKIYFKREESVLSSKFCNSTSLDLLEILANVQQLLREMTRLFLFK